MDSVSVGINESLEHESRDVKFDDNIVVNSYTVQNESCESESSIAFGLYSRGNQNSQEVFNQAENQMDEMLQKARELNALMKEKIQSKTSDGAT